MMGTVVAENDCGAILRYPLSFLAPLVDSPYSKPSVRGPDKKKRNKRHALNRGERDQLQHHAQIEKALTSSYSTLLSLGKEVGHFPVPQCTSTQERVSMDLVSLCDLDALASVQEPPSPYVLTGNKQDVDLFGHVITNQESCDITITALGVRFLVPAKSSFLLSDMSKIELLTVSHDAPQYSLLVMDPPWENRSAIRGKKYRWVSHEQLLGLPVPRLLAPQAVVVVWVTNKRSIAEFVRTRLFPHWNVEFIGEWYWIKVTTAGELVWPMDSTHKKPYETLVIGRARVALSGDKPDPLLPAESDDLTPDLSAEETRSDVTSCPTPPAKRMRREKSPTAKETLPSQLIFMATPTREHSQKPYLGDLLGKHVPDGRRLELFARNLLPGWTSWGNEVLKFQTIGTNDTT